MLNSIINNRFIITPLCFYFSIPIITNFYHISTLNLDTINSLIHNFPILSAGIIGSILNLIYLIHFPNHNVTRNILGSIKDMFIGNPVVRSNTEVTFNLVNIPLLMFKKLTSPDCIYDTLICFLIVSNKIDLFPITLILSILDFWNSVLIYGLLTFILTKQRYITSPKEGYPIRHLVWKFVLQTFYSYCYILTRNPYSLVIGKIMEKFISSFYLYYINYKIKNIKFYIPHIQQYNDKPTKEMLDKMCDILCA